MSTPRAEGAHQPVDSSVHRALLVGLVERGRCPTLDELAAQLGVSTHETGASLRRLEANHGLVLHPGTLEPWVVHPFSTTPTLFWVENGRRGWWAPCIWCALGIAVLVEGPVRISTRLAGEREPCEITHDQGRISPSGLLAHFPIPVARAWDNVHRHCSCTLVFDGRDQVRAWCERHGVPPGEILPVERVAELARVWYGAHLDPRWVKPTASQAAALLASVGLTGEHWRVPQSSERF